MEYRLLKLVKMSKKIYIIFLHIGILMENAKKFY